MRRWELTIEIDPAREQPLFLQLAAAITDGIRCGRLKPGEALPGSRELADFLDINRNTVVAAYGELTAEGLVTSRIGGGTFVAQPQPVAPPGPRALASVTPTYPLPPVALPPLSRTIPAPGTLQLRGSPDVRLLPARELARAFRRAIGIQGRNVLTCTDPRGHVRLRTQLAAMLQSTRGLQATADDVLITRSIEQGLDLVARTLIAPGDAVAIEALGYPPARRVMELAGAHLLPVPVDQDGLDVDALETTLKREPVRAVLLTPHHQFPTTVVMSPARRARLATLALQHRFAIVEDDYDHEFHYDGKPVLPIAAGVARANVVYVGSLANILAPGLCTAFVSAPPTVMERLVALRGTSDAQGDAAVECAVAELFEDGECLRHVRRMRRLYRIRRDALTTALVRHLGGAVDFRVPEGGLALWVRVDDGIDIEAWSQTALQEGVSFSPARPFDFLDRGQPFMRLGFSYHDPAELDDAARRMSRALARVRTARSSPGTATARSAVRREGMERIDAGATPSLPLARQSPHRVR
ncbi:MAG: PLP-dependent aminotransferase family protein [Xanthomonadaceae bacterium]|nr:PLP-dependent aminotransferase family protein [Xanthomonadaceae bacterium]